MAAVNFGGCKACAATAGGHRCALRAAYTATAAEFAGCVCSRTRET